MPKSFFKRDKNRTVADVFNKFIQPEMVVLAEDIGQKVTHDAKRTHQFQNRTGALEDSMRWEVKRRRDRQDIHITAGGPGRVKFPLRESPRATSRRGLSATGQRRRIRRRGSVLLDLQSGATSERQSLKSGDVINVTYATFVEKKGFSVLKNSVDKFRGRIPRIMRRFLRRGTARL